MHAMKMWLIDAATVVVGADWTLHPWRHNNVGGVTAGQEGTTLVYINNASITQNMCFCIKMDSFWKQVMYVKFDHFSTFKNKFSEIRQATSLDMLYNAQCRRFLKDGAIK